MLEPQMAMLLVVVVGVGAGGEGGHCAGGDAGDGDGADRVNAGHCHQHCLVMVVFALHGIGQWCLSHNA